MVWRETEAPRSGTSVCSPVREVPKDEGAHQDSGHEKGLSHAFEGLQVANQVPLWEEEGDSVERTANGEDTAAMTDHWRTEEVPIMSLSSATGYGCHVLCFDGKFTPYWPPSLVGPCVGVIGWIYAAWTSEDPCWIRPI